MNISGNRWRLSRIAVGVVPCEGTLSSGNFSLGDHLAMDLQRTTDRQPMARLLLE